MEAAVRIKQCVGDYKIGPEIIGQGNNAIVRLATNLRTQEKVAVKIIDITNPNVRERAFKEAEVLRDLGKHKSIIKLFAEHKDERFLYLFMEYASGGDLFTIVQRHGSLDETKARNFCRQIVDALIHCHERKIAHHDVKLENMLLAADRTLRLSDFGLSQRVTADGISAFSGSPLYMAPEIFSLQPHNERVDVWSLGICLYVMVTGTFPFIANTFEDLEEKVMLDEVPSFCGLSEELMHLIRGMLHKDCQQRFSLNQVRNHKWFKVDERPASVYPAKPSWS
jgi:serine/threonine protein kinase